MITISFTYNQAMILDGYIDYWIFENQKSIDEVINNVPSTKGMYLRNIKALESIRTKIKEGVSENV